MIQFPPIHPDCPFTAIQVARFRKRIVEDVNGCHVWLGAKCGDYGRVTIGRKCYSTHRVASMIANGPIPDGLIVLHGCPAGDNPICCNAEHLSNDTYKHNSEQMVERGRCCPPRGERAGNHVLTLEQVTQIKSALNEGRLTQAELARKFGVAHNTIHSIRAEISWANVEPRINDLLVRPNRKLEDLDYAVMRDLWRDGWTLKQLSEKYSVRVDYVQAIIKGKRGKSAPVGLRVIRQNKTKHTAEARQEMLRRYLAGEKQIDLAKEFGMSKNGISLTLQAQRRSP